MDFRSKTNVRTCPNIREDPDPTIQSQYSASPTILALVTSARIRIKPDTDIQTFYDNIFNIETAQGIGLDWWGRILGIGRYLNVEETGEWFGFQEADYDPFDTSPFWDGSITMNQVRMDDVAYRNLLMWKALANISTADAASINTLLSLLFPGENIVVHELGIMAIELYIFFQLTQYQRAILREYGLFARGAGVGFEWTEISEPVFGFFEADYEPFDSAPFWNGGGSINAYAGETYPDDIYPDNPDTPEPEFSAVYFIHGMGDTVGTTAGFVQQLNNAVPQRVVSLEYNYPYGEYTYKELMDNLVAGLSNGVNSRTLFIGESMGGFLAAQMAARYGGYCILACPVTNVYNDTAQLWNQSYNPWRWYYNGSDYCTSTAAQLQAMNTIGYDPRRVLASSHVGVITATNDTLIPYTTVVNYWSGHADTIYISNDLGHASHESATLAEYFGYINNIWQKMLESMS